MIAMAMFLEATPKNATTAYSEANTYVRVNELRRNRVFQTPVLTPTISQSPPMKYRMFRNITAMLPQYFPMRSCQRAIGLER